MQSFKSVGTINPARFVKIAPTHDSSCLQAGSGERSCGISQQWTQDPPIPGGSADAATSGELIKVYDLNETCQLQLGGTVAHGDLIISDADGKGVTGTGEVGAKALQSGVLDDLIRVQVIEYFR